MSTKANRVLIVDDEEDVCFLIKGLLEKENYEVEIAKTAQQFLDKKQDFKPESIILDINLPDGNGLDLLKSLNANSSNTKVIMHSAIDTQENRRIAADNGAVGFLSKPVDKHRLFELLRD